MAIDRADWHWDSAEKLYRKTHNITGGLTEEQENEIWLLAGNHIGLFLRWVIDRGFQGEDADPDSCDKVRNGLMSGAEYLMQWCDGKLWDEDIRDDILPFVKEYYDDGDRFFKDYCDCCGIGMPVYGFVSGDEDFARLKERMDAAYAKFAEGRQNG